MDAAINDILRTIVSSLQIPVIIVLLLIIVVTILLLGSLVVEACTERRRMKVKIPNLVDELIGKDVEQSIIIIETSGLLEHQKDTLKKLLTRALAPEMTREALARQLLYEEEQYYSKSTMISDAILRIAPMFGLLGTLIPLGPGLIALGQGDTATLSQSLLTAFDTTAAGVISAAVAFLISMIRKRWYDSYITGMETITETLLEGALKGEES